MKITDDNAFLREIVQHIFRNNSIPHIFLYICNNRFRVPRLQEQRGTYRIRQGSQAVSQDGFIRISNIRLFFKQFRRDFLFLRKRRFAGINQHHTTFEQTRKSNFFRTVRSHADHDIKLACQQILCRFTPVLLKHHGLNRWIFPDQVRDQIRHDCP